MVIPINVKIKNTAGCSFSLCEFFHNKNELPFVFLVFIMIGITISNDLFFQSLRQLKLYNSTLTFLKFSYYKHGKNANFHKEKVET